MRRYGSPTLPASHYRLTLPGSSARVSSPSLAALPDGRLAAVWLGEGHGQHLAVRPPDQQET